MIFKIQRTFSCAHRYDQPQWSAEKNQREFGKCFSPHGHGHDYVLEIEIETEGKGDSDSDSWVESSSCVQKVIESIDHQHLNFAVPEFQTQIPTTENLSLYLQSKISALLNSLASKPRILSLTLHETPDIWVELSSEARPIE